MLNCRTTKSDFERALSLFEEAVRLDPAFAGAHADIANTCQEMNRIYDRNPALLDRAAEAAAKVQERSGNPRPA